MTPKRWAFLVAVIGGMGLSAPCIRLVSAPALAVVVWRIAMCWPALAGMALWRKERWPLGGVWAGCFLLVHWIAWVLALQSTSIAAAATLVSTGSLWAALFSQPLLGERVDRWQWAGLCLALIGIVLIVTSESSGRHSLSGDLWALLSALAWVGYTFIGRKARANAAFAAYTATTYGTAGALALIIAIATGTQLTSLGVDSWAALFGLAMLPTLLGHGGINYLLRYMPAAQLSLWTLGETVISTTLAWPLFGEVPSPRVALGGALTLVGVGLGVYVTTATGDRAAPVLSPVGSE